MRVLVADDDPVSAKVCTHLLEHLGHEVLAARNGDEAWDALQRPEAPRFAVLDWMMPGIDGVELCRRLRGTTRHSLSYLVIVTSRSRTDDLVQALDAGANDFLAKPIDPAEFTARITVGVNSLARQDRLLEMLVALHSRFSHEFKLSAPVPVCMYCKSVRDSSDQWQEREAFLGRVALANLSHGICPACEDGIVGPMLERWASSKAQSALSGRTKE